MYFLKITTLVLASFVGFALGQETLFKAYSQQALDFEKEEKYLEAEKFWKLAIKEADNFKTNDSRRCEIRSAAAEFYFRQGKYSDAIKTSNEAVVIARDVPPVSKGLHYQSLAARLLTQISIITNDLSKALEAEKVLTKVLAEYEKLNLTEKGKSNWDIAQTKKLLSISQRESGNYLKSDKSIRDAISFCEKMPDQKGLGDCFKNYAYSLVKQKKYKEAKLFSNKAVSFLEKGKNDGPQHLMGCCFHYLGLVALDEKDLEQAFFFFSKADENITKNTTDRFLFLKDYVVLLKEQNKKEIHEKYLEELSQFKIK